jgi:Carboxypeptidase regulatory-like domain
LSRSTSSGGFSGVAYSQSGSTLAGAVVTVRSSNGSTKSTKTSTSGVWKLSSLSTGAYTVTVTSSGYSPASLTVSIVGRETTLAVVTLAP